MIEQSTFPFCYSQVDEFTVVDGQDAVGIPDDLAAVGRHDQCLTIAPHEFIEQTNDVAAGIDIEIAGRFVREYQFRSVY